MNMSDEHRELYEAFFPYEALRGMRESHLNSLRHRLRWFFRWLEECGLSWRDISPAVARSYQSYLIAGHTQAGTPYSVATVTSYRKAAASFCRFLAETKRIESNPFQGMRGPRLTKTVLEGVPKEAEMAKLLQVIGHWEAAGDLRAQMSRYLLHVIAELQYASGLRISEVANLTADDIDLSHRLVTVRLGKMGRDRVAYLSEYAANVLEHYMDQMRPLMMRGWNTAHRQYLFGCTPGSLGNFVNRHLKQIGHEMGVTITSHGFRHALGYHLLRAGCPLRHIQEIMGHENLKDTEVYTKVDVTAVQTVLDEHHPRGAHAV